MSYHSLPYIYEKEGSLERSWDIYSRLLKDRIIFIGSVIDDFIANSVVAQLLFLQMENPTKDVSIYINSPGGSITAGLAIIDTMNFINCKIKTFCVGMCGNIASLILSNGCKGFRYSLPHSRILIYQPIGSVSGQTTDIVLAAREVQK
jgi:ATP-dependent Clp protease protease subunit